MRQMLIAAGCLVAAMPLGWIAANTASSPTKGKEPRRPLPKFESYGTARKCCSLAY